MPTTAGIVSNICIGSGTEFSTMGGTKCGTKLTGTEYGIYAKRGTKHGTKLWSVHVDVRV